MEGFWTSFAAGVLPQAADILTDMLPVVGLLAALSLAISLAFTFVAIVRR